eukprot:1235911-Amphidinium_carterae.1
MIALTMPCRLHQNGNNSSPTMAVVGVQLVFPVSCLAFWDVFSFTFVQFPFCFPGRANTHTHTHHYKSSSKQVPCCTDAAVQCIN